MPQHAEKRPLPYTPQQMYQLVADIEKYPEFLPWCVDCRIIGQKKNTVLADLTVGYKMFRETFRSEVTLNESARTINVKYLDGPFKYLNNSWSFVPAKNASHCVVDFQIDFEFRNGLLQKIMGLFFHEAVQRMVTAFEARAAECYGQMH